MKNLFILTSLSAIFIVFIFSAEIFSKNFPEAQQKIISENLTVGLKSDNPGIRISCAQRIFEFIQDEGFDGENFSSTVIPLMKMLRDGNSELERISAALSLYKLEDARGIYMIKRSSEFDDSEKVKLVGKNLYYSYLKKK